MISAHPQEKKPYRFVVFLAPNMAGTGNSNGQALFNSIGCALCHNPSYQTDPARKIPTDFAGHTTQVITALSNQTVNLYSDLLIHHMGPGLADCMQLPTPLPSGGTQADGDQWRTAPLWGLSTRTVYLHDGRTTDLMTAIEKHSSFAGASAYGNTYPDSEANQVKNKRLVGFVSKAVQQHSTVPALYLHSTMT